MKKVKNYNLVLLIIGLALIIVQVANFTIRSHYSNVRIGNSSTIFDNIIFLGLGAILVTQPSKSSSVFSNFLLSFYSLIMIIIASNTSTRTDQELFFVMFQLLAYVTFFLGSLFAIIQVVTNKFDEKFVRLMILGLFIFASISFIISGIIIVQPSLADISILIIMTIVILLANFSTLFGLDQSTKPDKLVESVEQADNLHKLYERGLITKSEYESRLKK